MNENDFFGTSDLSLAAALLAHGAMIEAVDRGNGPRATFLFRREKGLDALVEGYWAHALQVEPLRYFNALKEAKSRLYGPPIVY